MATEIISRGAGRPPTYDKDIIVPQVCERLARGETLAAICRTQGFPTDDHVRRWALDDAEIASAIARARDLGADAIAEQAMDIADLPPAYKTSEGGQSIDQGDVANRKLQIETRLKLLAKWNPKKYGDKLEVDNKHSGSVGFALTINPVRKP